MRVDPVVTPGGFVVRRAVTDDVDGIAAVFGEAFGDYRLGFGVTATQLARLWRGSLHARVARITVAWVRAIDQPVPSLGGGSARVPDILEGMGPSAQIVGFTLAVMPGEEEFPADRGKRERPPFVELIGWRNMWRLPAVFVPMGIAFARRRTRADEAYLSFLGVAPAWQGRGVGGALLDSVARDAVRAGASGILLHTARDNASAQRTYRRAGYVTVSRTRFPWTGPNGIDGYVAMRCDLSSRTGST